MSWSRILRPSPDTPGEVVNYALSEVGSDAPPALTGAERQAYDRGVAAGERAGRDAALKESDATRRALERLQAELTAQRDAIALEAERHLVELAVAIARRLVRLQLALQPEALQEIVQQALTKIGRADAAVIRVHPDALGRLDREALQLTPAAQGVRWIRLEADPQLQPGECIVATGQRLVDARIDSQLDWIEQALLRAIETRAR